MFATNTSASIKVGGGQLDLTGSTPNQITGVTTVLQGTLFLDKTGGAGHSRQLVSLATTSKATTPRSCALGASNQIPRGRSHRRNAAERDAQQLRLAGSERLQRHDRLADAERRPDLQRHMSPPAAGVLTLGGTLTANEGNGTSGASPPATISGYLDLGISAAFPAAANQHHAARSRSTAPQAAAIWSPR